MFNDLITENLIGMSQVKASPSVNSPNDGDFNSEENARWATKKLTTKPFVVGQTEEEVANNSFGNDMTIGGYSFYTGSALFSIDGYLFKLAKPGETSYDYPQRFDSGIGVDCAHVQKFVSGLTNYGTLDALQTNYSDFMFSDYDPTNGITAQLKQAWEDACNNGTVVGYIKNVYKNTYFEALTLSPSGNTVTYGKTTIECSLVSDPSGPDFFQNETEPLAKVRHDSGSADPTGVDIYYPICLKKVRYYDEVDKQYKFDYRLYFTDIFGLETVFKSINSATRLYPNTENIWNEINENVPFTDINFTDCDIMTYDGTIYDYVSTMYTAGTPYQRKSLDDTVSISTGVLNIESLYDVYYIDNLDPTKDLMSYMPEVVETDKIPSIRNKVKYYCFKPSEHNMFTQLALSVSENGPKIPVAFMTSDGKLCPDGFYWGNDGSGVSTTYPVEGYLHFIKRVYVSIQSPAATEEDIQNVTIQDLLNWTESHNFGNGISMNFADFYNILYKHICIYMQVAYSSLMENVVLKTDVSSTSFKAFACGEALANVQSADIIYDEFITYQKYTYNGYTNNNGTLESTSFQYDIPHNKDISSDSEKFRIGTLSPQTTNIFESYNYNEVIDENNISDYIMQFEDPINLIKRCTDDTTATGFLIDKVYTYTNSSIEYIAIYNQSRKLILDEFLIPVIQDKPNNGAVSIYQLCSYFVLLGTLGPGGIHCSSFVNGLQYQVRKNAWIVYIPFVASTRKDSLNYLSGKNYIDGKYNGLNFRFVLDNDFNQDDLVLFKYKGQSIPKVTSYGIETFNNGYNISDSDIKTAREAFLHVSKVYDGDRELGMILDDIQSDVDYVQNEIEEQVDDIRDRVEILETTVYTGTTGLVDRVASLDDTIYDPDDGLVAVVGRCRKLLYSGELRVMHLGDHVYYRVYGFSEADTNKICEIFTTPGTTAGIGAYSSPFDTQSDESDLCPLINMGIGTVTVRPGIKSIQAYVFSFDFEILNLPYTLSSIWPYACSGSSSRLTGPLYVNFQNGVRLLNGYCFRYSRVQNICIPNTVVGGLSVPDVNRVLGAAQSAFVDCTNMSEITFDCHDVGTTVCENCSALSDVSMTANVKHIYPYPFVGCSSYLTINYLGSKDEFLAIHRDQYWDSLDVSDTSHIQTICCSDYYATYDPDTDNYVWNGYPVE